MSCEKEYKKYQLETKKEISIFSLAAKIAENYGIASPIQYYKHPKAQSELRKKLGLGDMPTKTILECTVHDLARNSDSAKPYFRIGLEQLPDGLQENEDIKYKPARYFTIAYYPQNIDPRKFKNAVEQTRQELGGILR